jgi:hypothetical protein
MAEHPRTNAATPQTNSPGINPDDREQILLDDLRVEISRLADELERRNDLLEARTSEANR